MKPINALESRESSFPDLDNTVAVDIEVPASQGAEDRSRTSTDGPGATRGAAAGESNPEPLMRAMEVGVPYPVDALGTLAEVVKAIARLAQAPLALAAQSVIGAASVAVQGLVNVALPTGESAPVSLYLLSSVESGGRKSTCDRYALKGLRQFEEENAERHRGDIGNHHADLDAWEAVRRHIVAAPKGKGAPKPTCEEIARKLGNLGPKPTPPMEPGVITTEPTAEGLLKRFERGRPSLGLFNAEGGSFLAGHAMSDENRKRSAAVLNAMWDGAGHLRDRAGDGSSRIVGKRLTIHVAATPDLVCEFLSRPDLRDNGLFSRLLIAAPESLAGTRYFREPTEIDLSTVDSFAARVAAQHRVQMPMRNGGRELDPPSLPLNEAAKEVWKKFHDDVERELGATGELGSVRERVNKTAENSARLAAVLTVIADPGAKVVGAAAMRGAVTVLSWHLSEVLRMEGAGALSPAIRRAEALRKWLINEWSRREEAAIPEKDQEHAPPNSTAVVTLRDCYTFGPYELRTKADAEPCIAILVNHGWLVAAPVVAGKGRPAGVRYFIQRGPK